ncbi:MAG: YraN family protein [Christensenella sp.]|nr:YraN family protein [Christensenella sp.]
MSTTSIGRGGEMLAREFLERRGYILLRQNYRNGPREIDLVMRDQDSIVFVEVKARSQTRYGTPAEFVTTAKKRQLTLAAEAYLMEENLWNAPARFDVVEVYLASGQVNHIENAFDAT